MSYTEFWPIYEFESILNRISVPTVEKGYEFFAWTFVFHMDMGINKELLSVLTDNLKLNWSWKLKSMDKKNRFWRNMNESPQWALGHVKKLRFDTILFVSSKSSNFRNSCEKRPNLLSQWEQLKVLTHTLFVSLSLQISEIPVTKGRISRNTHVDA